jgi:hypothetical protein
MSRFPKTVLQRRSINSRPHDDAIALVEHRTHAGYDRGDVGQSIRTAERERSWSGPASKRICSSSPRRRSPAPSTDGQPSSTSGCSMNMRAELGRDSQATAEPGAPDEVMARIRKLFALAGSPNEHEAALALEKAHALLLRYNLRAETVTDGSDRQADEVTDVWLPGSVAISGVRRYSGPWPATACANRCVHAIR